MSLSIIIPAHNEEKYLPILLASLARAQKHLRDSIPGYPVQVIVVDNCSTDKTASVARAYCAQVVTEEKRNIAAVRNRGAAVATGDYLVIIDADYRVEDNFMESIVNAFDRGANVPALGVRVVVEKNEVNAIWRFFGNSLLLILRHVYGMSFGVFGFRKTYFEHLGGFDEDVYGIEDLELHAKIKRDLRAEPARYLVLMDTTVYASARGFSRDGMVTTYARMFFFPRARRKPELCQYWYGEQIIPDAPRRTQSAWRSIYDMSALLPKTLLAANRRCRGLVECFESYVDPVLALHISDSRQRSELRARMLPFATKVAFFIQNFADMIGTQVSPSLSLLVGAFTRVYDDLIDENGPENLDERMFALFHDGHFEPRNELETLFLALYTLLDEQLPKTSFPVCRAALDELHVAQIRSRAQSTSLLSDRELLQITLLKGAKAELVFCGVAKREMDSEEQKLIEDLGGCFQYMDDYEDYYKDKKLGVSTLATRGHLRMKHITDWIGALSIQLQDRYGHANARAFVTHIHYWATIARMNRTFKWLGLKRRVGDRPRTKTQPRVPIQVLMS